MIHADRRSTRMIPSPQFFLIRRRDRAPIAFAGLWERSRGHGAEKPLETFTIITTKANELVRPIHERMPLILSPDQFDAWLFPSPTIS
jgi:putative SOS response-associated peptidase YedK